MEHLHLFGKRNVTQPTLSKLRQDRKKRNTSTRISIHFVLLVINITIRHSQLPLCLNVEDGHLQKTQSNLQMGNWRIPGEYFCGKQQRIYFHHCFPFTSLLTTTFQLLCDFANIFSMGALVKVNNIKYYKR